MRLYAGMGKAGSCPSYLSISFSLACTPTFSMRKGLSHYINYFTHGCAPHPGSHQPTSVAKKPPAPFPASTTIFRPVCGAAARGGQEGRVGERRCGRDIHARTGAADGAVQGKPWNPCCKVHTP